jgi:hypothetical protein
MKKKNVQTIQVFIFFVYNLTTIYNINLRKTYVFNT